MESKSLSAVCHLEKLEKERVKIVLQLLPPSTTIYMSIGPTLILLQLLPFPSFLFLPYPHTPSYPFQLDI